MIIYNNKISYSNEQNNTFFLKLNSLELFWETIEILSNLFQHFDKKLLQISKTNAKLS